MKFHLLKRKNAVSLALLFILIFTSLLFVGCGKKPEDKPQPTPSERKGFVLFRFQISIRLRRSLSMMFLLQFVMG